MSDTLAKNRIGQAIRGTHPHSFRSGEWALIIGLTRRGEGHLCFRVIFPDGTRDQWVVHDPDEPYEFRESP